MQKLFMYFFFFCTESQTLGTPYSSLSFVKLSWAVGLNNDNLTVNRQNFTPVGLQHWTQVCF